MLVGLGIPLCCAIGWNRISLSLSNVINWALEWRWLLLALLFENGISLVSGNVAFWH